MAQIIGIDEKTWRDTWSARFSHLEAVLNTLESQALNTLEKNLDNKGSEEE
ncbi:MAG: hypothetical protein HQL73_09915 [Magnetococcales bacterium]|nr:hypothetical protein [Magnetococcales bacterium]